MHKIVVTLSLCLSLISPVLDIVREENSYVAVTTETDTETVKLLQHGMNG